MEESSDAQAYPLYNQPDRLATYSRGETVYFSVTKLFVGSTLKILKGLPGSSMTRADSSSGRGSIVAESVNSHSTSPPLTDVQINHMLLRGTFSKVITS